MDNNRTSQLKTKSSRKFSVSGWRTSRAISPLLLVMFALLFYLSISPNWIQQTYDIQVDGTSDRDIISPRQIENVAATVRARTNAAEAVEPVHTTVAMRNEDLLELLFSKLEQVNPDSLLTSGDKIAIYRTEFPQLFRDFYERLLRNNRDMYNESLTEEITTQLFENEYRIPEETFFKLPAVSLKELAEMETVAKSIVSKLMSDRFTDPQTARAKVPEMVNASSLTNRNSREIVQELARYALTGNRFYDEEATKEAKVKASENLAPIFINKGDVVVSQGERISEEKYALLKELELLKDNANYWSHIGTAAFAAMLAFILYMYIRQSGISVSSNNSQLVMLLFIYVLTTMALVIVSIAQNDRFPFIGYIAPVAMGSMLIAILIEARIAYLSSMLFSILAAITLNTRDEVLFDYRYGIVALIICFVSIFATHKASQRAAVLRAGAMVALFSSLSACAILMIEGANTLGNLLYAIGFSSAGGLLTAVLVIGLLPFFEIAFGILSPLKLVELSNPNHPLLRKLLTETPGTYHHSVMVGNLSEAAAEAIGANGLLCRVGSFYHDIGKTKRPSYFIENQTNIENPHDQIDPSLSKSIIVAHARDGVDMLTAHKMPKAIRDIAEQHHGTTLLKFFYVKAVKQLEEKGGDGKAINEDDYRYPGPKAQTREAAIVGIADSIEAAIRSLRNPTTEQIDSMVRKIIKARLEDGELNECDLTMKELDTIARTLNETLFGIFHSRIEYPEELPVKTSYPDKPSEEAKA